MIQESRKGKKAVTPTASTLGAGLAASRLVARSELSYDERDAVRRYFLRSVFAALTPLAVGPGHPFPRLAGGALAVAVALRRRDARHPREAPLLAVVEIPAGLPRTVPVPREGGPACALVEDAVLNGVGDLFPGRVVEEAAVFRIAGARLELAIGASRRLELALAAALKHDGREVDRVAGPLRPIDLHALDGGLQAAPRPAPAAPAPAVPDVVAPVRVAV
jgi:polyphosphate kinase